MILNNEEKEKLLIVMSSYYQWLNKGKKDNQGNKDNQGKKDDNDNVELFRKIAKGEKTFGEWKLINTEMEESEKRIEDMKREIIFLKHNVLYNYIDKEKAIKRFVDVKKELLEENETLKATYDDYFTNVEMIEKESELMKFQKIYNENIIVYKNKMKMALVSDLKKRQQLVKECVKISMFLTDLSEKIRLLKYQKVEVDEEHGIRVEAISLEKRFRVYKSENMIEIK
jgi:hypothetical protein